MKIQDIFTADELALIDSGNYKPGRAVLDAKLDLAMAIEREACAKVCDAWQEWGTDGALLAKAIRARGDT
jgi:hypothetical protein